MIRSAPSRLAASTPHSPDGAVAHHHDGPAGTHLRGERRMVAGGHHIGQGQQAVPQCVVRLGDAGNLDQRGVGQRNTDRLALAAVDREAGRRPCRPSRPGGRTQR